MAKAKYRSKLRIPTVLTAVICFVCMMTLTAYFQLQQSKEEQLQIEYIARTIESETYETLLTQMQKTRVLEAHLIETNGRFDTFAPIAEGLIKEKALRSLIFAPNSIVEGIFPTENNQPVIGLDLNSNGVGNLEAQEAIRANELFLAGPFELVEGGMGICGRLPVYLPNANGEREYWGLVSVTLNYPDIFEGHPIEHVDGQGFACRVWRINPDDNQHQIILETKTPINDYMQVQQFSLSMFNATWTIDIAPQIPWFQRPTLWILVFASISVSLMAAYGVESQYKVRKMKADEALRQIKALQQQLDWEQTNTLLSQISTHFFYHTLNALQALIILKPQSAYKMAGDFSRYLRFNIDAIAVGGGIVSFKEELRAVRAYADINELQLGDRLHVIFDVPDVDFKIPALTIEPIVGNAILHGIKPKVGGGTVRVTLTQDETNWYVTVADDGLGFDISQQPKETSIGLSNVRQRIKKFPGCSLEIDSKPGQGTTVVLIYQKNLEHVQ